MNVKLLKELIKDLPDDALVLTETPHAIIEARAKVGTARDPNDMGFTNFLEDDIFECQAVFIYSGEY
jgi:hypothetical protein